MKRQFERRVSMIYSENGEEEEEENTGLAEMHQYNTHIKYQPYSSSTSGTGKTSLDDLDMVGLSTQFDHDMYRGYLDTELEGALRQLVELVVTYRAKYGIGHGLVDVLVRRVDPAQRLIKSVSSGGSTSSSGSSSGSSGSSRNTDMGAYLATYETVSAWVERLSVGVYEGYMRKKIAYLRARFELYANLCTNMEIQQTKLIPHKDFYNVVKVDADLLVNGCFSIHQLSGFVNGKLRTEPGRLVSGEQGSKLTLREYLFNKEYVVIDSAFLEWYQYVYLPNHPSVGGANIPQEDTRKRQLYYRVAELFLEIDNGVQGQYLHELIEKCVFKRKSKHQLYQLSLDFKYDKHGQWASAFVKFNNLFKRKGNRNIQWNIRVHRNFPYYYHTAGLLSFQEFLDSIENMVVQVRGQGVDIANIDVVYRDSDSYLWKHFTCDSHTTPDQWCIPDNPPLSYYMFYIQQIVNRQNSNNSLRVQQTGEPRTIHLRNNCGTLASMGKLSQFSSHTGDSIYKESLISNMLLATANQIISAEPIAKSPVFTYLYYILQITCVVSPLSTVSQYYGGSELHGAVMSELQQHEESDPHTGDKKYIKEYIKESTADLGFSKASNFVYRGNPFMDMHKLGMRVALSSHSIIFNNSYTKDPLLEEYSVAASIYLIGGCDMCELALNSTIDASVSSSVSSALLSVSVAEEHHRGSSRSPSPSPLPFTNNTNDSGKYGWDDDANKHNVASIRRKYRISTWLTEMKNLQLLPISSS